MINIRKGQNPNPGCVPNLDLFILIQMPEVSSQIKFESHPLQPSKLRPILVTRTGLNLQIWLLSSMQPVKLACSSPSGAAP